MWHYTPTAFKDETYTFKKPESGQYVYVILDDIVDRPLPAQIALVFYSGVSTDEVDTPEAFLVLPDGVRDPLDWNAVVAWASDWELFDDFLLDRFYVKQLKA